MTVATDMIYARPVGATRDWEGATSGPWSLSDPYGSAVAYRRDDLPPTDAQVLAHPLVVGLVEIMREAASDLTAYVDAEYSAEYTRAYPSLALKHHRDLEIVRRIDAALARIRAAQEGGA